MRIAITLGLVVAARALAGGLGSPARADGSVGVIVTGEGSVQPQLTAQITDWLSRHGHTVIASPLPPEAIPQLADCFVLERITCAREIVDTLAKSSSLVYARADASNDASSGDQNVTLTAYWFDKGHDAIAERRTCERCTPQSLRTTADEVMRKLIGGDGHVKLRSTPSGAKIKIDNQDIGVTPLDWDLPPGKHTIQMTASGLAPGSQDIVVVGGKTDMLAIQLSPLDEPSPLWSRHVPLAMVVTGGALVVAGGILIAVDQDLGPMQPPTIHDTAPAGVAMMIGGVVLGGAGAYLRWIRPDKKTSTPIAVFTSNTAYVGWTGQF